MVTRFDRTDLTARLGELDAQRRITFAALCAERLLPRYARFVELETWGSTATLRAALDRVWDCIAGRELRELDAEALHAAVRDVTPDTEDFNGSLASRAMDAAVAVGECVALCLDASPDRAAEVGEIAFETALGDEQEAAAEPSTSPMVGDRAQLLDLLKGPRVIDELDTQGAILAALATDAPIDTQGLRSRFAPSVSR